MPTAFSKGDSKNKLILLLILQEIGGEMLRDQIYQLVFDANLMTYFDFQNVFFELEEDGWIAAIPRAYGQAYRISAAGEQALDSLRDGLPNSIATEIRRLADEKREQIRTETAFPTSVRMAEDGSYYVYLSALDGGKTSLSVEMCVPTREAAKKIRENWSENSLEVYRILFMQLTSDSKKD